MKPLRVIFNGADAENNIFSVVFDNGKCYNVNHSSFVSRVLFKARTGFSSISIIQGKRYLMFNTENDKLSVSGN